MMPLLREIGDWAHSWLMPALLRRRAFRAATIASVLAIVYWGVIASDRYVSEAHVVIQSTDLSSSQTPNIGSLLGISSDSQPEQLLLRDYLLSIDMLNKLDAKLNLRAHYSDWYKDPLSRMWIEGRSQELFYRYFLSRVNVDFDEHAGILVIKAQGFDPETAHAITSMLVAEGERHMNQMMHQLAQEQVDFLEKQVEQMGTRLMQANQALLSFQNQKGMISPQATVESLSVVINGLEAKRTELQVKRNSLLGQYSNTAPNVRDLDWQIETIDKQLETERARLASPDGKPLNRTAEEFQRLQMAASFAQDIYKSALVALEQGRIETARTLKKVSVLQSPTLPQYPVEPARLYNMLVFVLVAMMLAGIISLLAAIIKDHVD